MDFDNYTWPEIYRSPKVATLSTMGNIYFESPAGSIFCISNNVPDFFDSNFVEKSLTVSKLNKQNSPTPSEGAIHTLDNIKYLFINYNIQDFDESYVALFKLEIDDANDNLILKQIKQGKLIPKEIKIDYSN